MNVLRLEHQRKHKQRNGFYPHDNEEEMYEQQIKLSVDGKAMVCLFLTDFKRRNFCFWLLSMYVCLQFPYQPHLNVTFYTKVLINAEGFKL